MTIPISSAVYSSDNNPIKSIEESENQDLNVKAEEIKQANLLRKHQNYGQLMDLMRPREPPRTAVDSSRARAEILNINFKPESASSLSGQNHLTQAESVSAANDIKQTKKEEGKVKRSRNFGVHGK